MVEINGDFTHQLLVCPYCPKKSKSSHRTACYKVKVTGSRFVVFKCVACRKSFKVKIDSNFIIKDENLKAIYEPKVKHMSCNKKKSQTQKPKTKCKKPKGKSKKKY